MSPPSTPRAAAGDQSTRPLSQGKSSDDGNIQKTSYKSFENPNRYHVPPIPEDPNGRPIPASILEPKYPAPGKLCKHGEMFVIDIKPAEPRGCSSPIPTNPCQSATNVPAKSEHQQTQLGDTMEPENPFKKGYSAAFMKSPKAAESKQVQLGGTMKPENPFKKVKAAALTKPPETTHVNPPTNLLEHETPLSPSWMRTKIQEHDVPISSPRTRPGYKTTVVPFSPQGLDDLGKRARARMQELTTTEPTSPSHLENGSPEVGGTGTGTGSAVGSQGGARSGLLSSKWADMPTAEPDDKTGRT